LEESLATQDGFGLMSFGGRPDPVDEGDRELVADFADHAFALVQEAVRRGKAVL
jgi:hypothetical protein